MSYKARALKIAESFGATYDFDAYFLTSEEVWSMDFWTPKGIRWKANGWHASWTREVTLTDCWKDFIQFAKLGVEPCPAECDCWHWDDEDQK